MEGIAAKQCHFIYLIFLPSAQHPPPPPFLDTPGPFSSSSSPTSFSLLPRHQGARFSGGGGLIPPASSSGIKAPGGRKCRAARMTGRTLEWRTSTHFSTVRRLPLLPDTTHPPPRRTKVHHFPTLRPSLELTEANVSQALAAGVVGSTVRHRGGGQARKLTCHNKVPTAPSHPSRASLHFSSAKGTLKVWLLLFFFNKFKICAFSFGIIFFSLSLSCVRVCM